MKCQWVHITGGCGREIVSVGLGQVSGRPVSEPIDLVFTSVSSLAEFVNTLAGVCRAENARLKRPYAKVKISVVTRHKRARKEG